MYPPQPILMPTNPTPVSTRASNLQHRSTFIPISPAHEPSMNLSDASSMWTSGTYLQASPHSMPVLALAAAAVASHPASIALSSVSPSSAAPQITPAPFLAHAMGPLLLPSASVATCSIQSQSFPFRPCNPQDVPHSIFLQQSHIPSRLIFNCGQIKPIALNDSELRHTIVVCKAFSIGKR